MHHLAELHIQQFRGLSQLSLTQLGSINVIIGGNTSGKSSILEAIALFCRPLDPAQWMGAVYARGMTISTVSLLEYVKWLFPQTHATQPGTLSPHPISLSGKGTFPVRSVTATLSEHQSRKPSFSALLADEEDDDDESPISNRRMAAGGVALTVHAAAERLHPGYTTETFSDTFHLHLDERLMFRRNPACPALETYTITPHTHMLDHSQMHLTESFVQDLATQTLPLLLSFDQAIEGLHLWSQSGVRPALYIAHQQLGLIPLNAIGNGIRRVLALAMMALHSQQGVLMIDELEHALHPAMVPSVMQWLLQTCLTLDIQLFLTTHTHDGVGSLLDAVLTTQHPAMQLVTYQLEMIDGMRIVTRKQL